MSARDAVEQVLAQAGKPMRIEEITQRILQSGLWHTSGKTPAATVSAQLATDIKRHGLASRFQRTGRGRIALRTWGLPEYLTNIDSAQTVTADIRRLDVPHSRLLTLKDAAEVVLISYAGERPMSYRAVVEKALEHSLIATSSENAASTLLMEIMTDISRQAQRGSISRFTHPGRGLIGLSKWTTDDLQSHPRISSHRAISIRKGVRDERGNDVVQG